MQNKKINLSEKLSLFQEYWSPRIIDEMNDYQFKVVKIRGDFVWHSHADTDETFIVIDGNMTIELKDEKVHLEKGEMYVVPKGVEHKPYASSECKILLIEPKGIVNTGDVKDELTLNDEIWI